MGETIRCKLKAWEKEDGIERAEKRSREKMESAEKKNERMDMLLGGLIATLLFCIGHFISHVLGII